MLYYKSIVFKITFCYDYDAYEEEYEPAFNANF